MIARLILAFLLPILAGAVQWLLWDAWIKPYVWFLFFPAAFFSAWLGGLAGGLGGTALSALLVWYLFIPPSFSFTLDNPAAGASIVLFLAMGALFGWFFERLGQAMRRTDAALAETRTANEKITELYRKTLELDELKSQFFANVSHELRTPLTLIMAPLERRLRRSAGADFPAGERHESEMMLRNARLLYRHVSDLLDAAKIEAGGMGVDYARLDVAELVRALAAHFDSVAGERGIEYRIETPAVLVAEIDGEKLQRILLNLLANAFKFVADGGRVVVRLAARDGQAVLEVQDNGPGIPDEQREAIFQRFRQAEGGANRRHGGTGLGLSIVREFAALHGGTAEVAEAPGGGALFAVRLPLTAPAGTLLRATAAIDTAIEQAALDEFHAPAAAPAADPATAQAPLVLVVEDNADMSAFIATVLKSHYRVATAGNGADGLALALAAQPDLILADVMMPVMSGEALAQELRRRPEMADVPIVMLTAKADDALRVQLLQAGVQDYLAKPFSTDELLARVAGLIDQRRRTRDRLRESESRFAATFEQAAVGIALISPTGQWLRVNKKLCAIVGYTQEELLQKTFQDITHPDDLETDLAHVRRMLAGEIDTYALEKRYFRKDGGVIWINLTVSLARQADGAPDYFISVVEDISARKADEAELRKRNEALERFDRATVGRELEMVRLKRQVNELTRQLGREPPYELGFMEDGGQG